MNRRSFLKLFSAGLPSVVVAEKLGLTKYFFAPKGGWPQTGMITRDMLREAFRCCKYETDRMVFMNGVGIWEFRSTGVELISRQIEFPSQSHLRLEDYDSNGSLWRIEPLPELPELKRRPVDFDKALLIG